ncbi:unnamed protein product [Cuscuta campestris]|uniref:Uncharacterized protein n=1 Tax=Cuscuta campestris TaxID=132261 RepID=A0A484L2C6_9ASTE|nr:unnamed protein product [Cuscuta campestris]
MMIFLGKKPDKNLLRHVKNEVNVEYFKGVKTDEIFPNLHVLVHNWSALSETWIEYCISGTTVHLGCAFG